MLIYIYISLCGSRWYLNISFTLYKSNLRSIKHCCDLYRSSKLGCVWFLVVNNILKVGTGDIVTCIHLFPDGISIMALLGSGVSSSIRIFWGDAVYFEVFRKCFIPIKRSIWVFGLKVLLLVNLIQLVYWIIIGGDIYFRRNLGWNSIWDYINFIDSNVYRTRV